MRTTVLCGLEVFVLLCVLCTCLKVETHFLWSVLLWKAMYSIASDADRFKYQLSVVMT
jgi:hypothetical protein